MAGLWNRVHANGVQPPGGAKAGRIFAVRHSRAEDMDRPKVEFGGRRCACL